MHGDIQPAGRPRKSLHTKLDSLSETPKPSENFETPEEVAARDDIEREAQLVKDPSSTEAEASSSDEQPEKASAKKTSRWDWRSWFNFSWPPGRKEYIAAFVALIIIAGGTAGALALTHHSKSLVTAKPAIKAKPVVKPITVPSTLSGLPVAAALNQLPVTGVMIENSTDARPQSGLSQAMVVFEAVAEGGVTRFLALYQDTSPSSVGPIRSARPYYIQWALGFDAGYAHVGGSPDALSDIKSWNVHDLDQFANGSSYTRISSRAAPHNVYTAISTLNQLETKKGYTSSTFTGFPRKAEAPAKTPTAATISFNLSGAVYNPQYTYVAASNSYNRSEGGAPQIDANNNQQISPKVVIAMVVPETQGALDASGAYYSDYNVIGSGVADVFQDGTVTTGTWTKSSNTSQVTFANANGQSIKLNPGQTWLTAVTSSNKISYSP